MAIIGPRGRPAKSAGFLRNPQQHAGTGAIRRENEVSPKAKNPNRERLRFHCWWWNRHQVQTASVLRLRKRACWCGILRNHNVTVNNPTSFLFQFSAAHVFLMSSVRFPFAQSNPRPSSEQGSAPKNKVRILDHLAMFANICQDWKDNQSRGVRHG